MNTIRLSIATFNVWGSHHWPQRRDALTNVISTIYSDIILLQEVTQEILDCICLTHDNYDYIHDTSSISWMTESNIIYRKDIFELIEYGIDPLPIHGYPHRGFFWIKLKIKSTSSSDMPPLCIGTIHMPWTGTEEEISTGMNQRIPVTKALTQSILTKGFNSSDILIFGGDFNEDFHPLRIIQEELGMVDVFTSMDISPPITHPCRPSDPEEEIRPNRTLDWLITNSRSALTQSEDANAKYTLINDNIRIMAAFAKTIRGGKWPPPSDHLPVVAIVEIKLS